MSDNKITLSNRKGRAGIARVVALCAFLTYPMLAIAESIPEKEVDLGQIYSGSPKDFSNPAEVDLGKVIEATPEYQEITKKRIEPGTGKYWILTQQAKTRALRAVDAVAEDSEYDLIAEKGYLGNLKSPIVAEDITKQVLKELEE